MVATNETIRLVTAQTRTLLPLEDRTAGTTIRFLLIEGNSLLSTVFVESIDAGTTVKVNYYEDTTGRLASERKDLPSHVLQSVASTDPNKITVTPFHNSPILEAIVVGGGTARFSVHATVVNSFATDLDAALHLDADPADLLEDKGLPIQCYDETNDAFYFLRCDEGAISISGNVTLPPVTEVVTGTSLIADTVTGSIISHSPATDSKQVQRIVMGGDGYGEFTIKINGSLWATVRNSWNDRTKTLEFGNKVITTGDTITVEAKNVSLIGGGSCTYEAFIYLTEA